MSKTYHIIAAIIGVVILAVIWTTYGTGWGRPEFRHSNLAIMRQDGKIFPFSVEVATTPAEQAYGLMYVKSLESDAGMIFLYTPPQGTAFWMKNTLIPLDMLFVGADGSISGIVANARPQDLTPIPSPGPVAAVIEIKGGTAKADGFNVGDIVQSPLLTAVP